MKVLIADPFSAVGIADLKNSGFEVKFEPNLAGEKL